MSENKFYDPRAERPPYQAIAEDYADAFRRDPWRESTLCADRLKRCASGFSALAISEFCRTCEQQVTTPAYPAEQVIARFEQLAANKEGVRWYTESQDGQLALSALAWAGSPQTIADEKFADVPLMAEWVASLPDSQLAWLDEVFADTGVRASGNLRNFGTMCQGLMDELGCDAMAFRTINPRMIAATVRDFGADATVFTRGSDVPDRRDFVLIRRSQS